MKLTQNEMACWRSVIADYGNSETAKVLEDLLQSAIKRDTRPWWKVW